jgi:uncharacterized OB-fold protein
MSGWLSGDIIPFAIAGGDPNWKFVRERQCHWPACKTCGKLYAPRMTKTPTCSLECEVYFLELKRLKGVRPWGRRR